MADRAGVHGRRVTPLQVGTIVWLASELLFFGGLFAAYYFLRANADVWPPDDVELDTLAATVGTALLVISSGTMQLGVRAVLASRRQAFVAWLAVTFLLGAVFVGLQVRDWQHLDFGIDTHAYGSTFFLMTGFHTIHVVGGLAAMLVLGMRATDPRFGGDDAPVVESVSYYWHFVDVVWLGLFATLFFVQ